VNVYLKEAMEIVNDLKEGLKKRKTSRDEIKELNPTWEQLSEENWIDIQTNCWLHGATKIDEANELEIWLFDNPPLSATAKSNAKKCVKLWREWLEIKDTYYEPFEDFEFEEPKKNETLFDFIQRMAKAVEDEGTGARLEWRAFKCFLAYLKNISLDEVAFIEQIFPKKMGIFYGKIIRKVAPEVHSIPQETVAEILIELANRFQFGRQNAQLTTAESLGLCWLCLTASRLRLPIYIEKLHSIKSTALKLKGKFPILLIPTHFGDRPIRISFRVAKFLQAISLIPSKNPRKTILQSPLRSLTRTFDKALKKVSPNPKYGNITYVSLLNPPHHFGDYRYQSK
jgi:hypothetical protein